MPWGEWPLRRLGEPCADGLGGTHACEAGASCDGVRCIARRRVAYRCRDAECHELIAIEGPSLRAGQRCDAAVIDACFEARCLDGVCVAYRGLGEDCHEDPCAMGLQCMPAPVGGDCGSLLCADGDPFGG